MNFDQVINRWNTDCMKWDALEQRFGDPDLLPLWVADMDFQAPKEVINALTEQASHGIFGYPKTPDSLYEAIIKWLKKRQNWSVKKESISYALGVVPAICTAIQAFTKENDRILIQTPVYYPFFQVVKKNNRQLVMNELRYENNTYSIDFEDFERKIAENDVKLFILCNPHNPAGRVWTKEELVRMGDICKKHNVLVVADEIHGDLVLTGHEHIPFASISQDLSDITLTCIAPSKTFNLAGLQASVMVIENEALRKAFTAQVEAQGFTMINSFALTAMEAAYEHGEEWLASLISYVEGNIEFLTDFFSAQLPQLKVIKPEGTYLVWIDCNALNLSIKELEQLMLREAKVAVNQGYIFGKGGEGFIRINVACPKETLEDGLKRIKAAIDTL